MFENLTYEDILEPQRASYKPAHDTVARLCAEGFLDLDYRPMETVPEFSTLSEWADYHTGTGYRHHSAGAAHFRTKLLGAEILKRNGHTMATTPLETSEDCPAYTFDPECFERSGAGFQADVVCCCDDCTTIVEAGYTPPERVLSAFGYNENPSYPDDIHPTTPDAVRERDRDVESFVVLPYNIPSDDDRPAFVFTSNELPDARPGALAAVVDETLFGDEDA